MVTSAHGRTREIASPSNQLVKVFRRALADGTTREGWLAVEGPMLVGEALQAADEAAAVRVTIESVLVGRSAAAKFSELIGRLPKEAEVTEVPDPVFQSVAQTETPQGIAALVELAAPSLDDVLARPDALLVVACGVQDPGNLGTMMRSAQALGATALVTLPATVSPFNPKAARSSAGAVFRLPVFRNLALEELVERLRAVGVRTVAADSHGPATVAEADLRGRVALLIGNEAAGLDEAAARQADLRVSIPIRPGADSVNAAVAAGIFLYEAARQRGFKY